MTTASTASRSSSANLLTRTFDLDTTSRVLTTSRLTGVHPSTRTIHRVELTTRHDRKSKTYSTVLRRVTTVDGVEQKTNTITDSVLVATVSVARYNAKKMTADHNDVVIELLATGDVDAWGNHQSDVRPSL